MARLPVTTERLRYCQQVLHLRPRRLRPRMAAESPGPPSLPCLRPLSCNSVSCSPIWRLSLQGLLLPCAVLFSPVPSPFAVCLCLLFPVPSPPPPCLCLQLPRMTGRCISHSLLSPLTPPHSRLSLPSPPPPAPSREHPRPRQVQGGDMYGETRAWSEGGSESGPRGRRRSPCRAGWAGGEPVRLGGPAARGCGVGI